MTFVVDWVLSKKRSTFCSLKNRHTRPNPSASPAQSPCTLPYAHEMALGCGGMLELKSCWNDDEWRHVLRRSRQRSLSRHTQLWSLDPRIDMKRNIVRVCLMLPEATFCPCIFDQLPGQFRIVYHLKEQDFIYTCMPKGVWFDKKYQTDDCFSVNICVFSTFLRINA